MLRLLIYGWACQIVEKEKTWQRITHLFQVMSHVKSKKRSHDDEAPSNTEELPFSRKEQMRGSLLPTQW
jgi:hypothetical protein